MVTLFFSSFIAKNIMLFDCIDLYMWLHVKFTPTSIEHTWEVFCFSNRTEHSIFLIWRIHLRALKMNHLIFEGVLNMNTVQAKTRQSITATLHQKTIAPTQYYLGPAVPCPPDKQERCYIYPSSCTIHTFIVINMSFILSSPQIKIIFSICPKQEQGFCKWIKRGFLKRWYKTW